MSVKGSAQYRMVVMPYRPMRRVFNYFLIGILLTVAAFASFFWGYGQGSVQALQADPHSQENTQLVELEAENDKLRQQIANLDMAAKVDAQAHEDIRKQTVELKATIAELEHDIDVYRGIMPAAQSNNPQGISLGAFSLTGAGGVRGYKYKLIVRQLSANKESFNGSLSFTVVGEKGGKQQRIPLEQISEQVADARIPLSFKYFQTVEGDLILPEDFQPERIEVSLVSSDRKKSTQVERQLPWTVSSL